MISFFLGKKAKGFFFTLLIIVLFFFLLVLAKSWISTQQTYEYLDGVKARAVTVKSALEALDADANRMAALSGSKAAQSAAAYVSGNVTPLPDPSGALQWLAYNNTLNGTTSNFSASGIVYSFQNLSNKSCLSLFSDRFTAEAAHYGMTATFENWSVTVSQGSSFNLSVEAEFNISLNDSSGVLSYHRSETILANSSIIGAADPLYPLRTGGFYRRNITVAPPGYSPVRVLYNGSDGFNWSYGNVTNVDNLATSLANGDKTKLLVENIVGPCINNAAFNASLHTYGGVLFNSITGASTSEISIPWMQFSIDITDAVSNGTKLLINSGALHQVIDIENLRTEINGTPYYRSSLSPGFIQRLQYNYSNVTAGIESLVPYSLAANASYTTNSSWADFYYLNGTTCASTICYKIKGMQNCENETVCANPALPHFALDNRTTTGGSGAGRLQLYGVENITLPG
ncbi:Uncharacterised protein [uncultured archaeon]|nr:Uncharacterised protein [uncultured archaeon]